MVTGRWLLLGQLGLVQMGFQGTVSWMPVAVHLNAMMLFHLLSFLSLGPTLASGNDGKLIDSSWSLIVCHLL